ncbi:lipid II:glycine glycyltransferase FemX [Methanococcoides sp.]|uniref:lipid II:glycine glycyltransferase FemX n=1 Tax=Methanococcoides sp. TaxID=1966350 RepID=UPI00272DCF4D|nr:GNAT family N-acetyltransferase [Methanococcoides sp.]
MIEITDSFDKVQWDNFVSDHPHGNIFQTTEMVEVYRQAKNYEPVSLAAVDTVSGDIFAVVQAAVICEISGIGSSFSARSVIHGGPLAFESREGTEAVSVLMGQYNALMKRKAIYTQIRNIWDIQESKQMLESLGYTYSDHLNYLIDLDRTADTVWQSIHKSRRKGINRAEKAGIEIKKIENDDELVDSYNLIEQTYRNVRMPIADISLFRAVYNLFAPTGMADFYMAIQDGMPVGTRVVLKYNDLVYDWYAGSKKEVEYVDEALVWCVLKENAGTYKTFDFGGAGHPSKPYGVREFKRRFGGKEVNFGRYEKTHDKFKNRIAEVGYGIYKKLKCGQF